MFSIMPFCANSKKTTLNAFAICRVEEKSFKNWKNVKYSHIYVAGRRLCVSALYLCVPVFIIHSSNSIQFVLARTCNRKWELFFHK